jgi:hypothetical protein
MSSVLRIPYVFHKIISARRVKTPGTIDNDVVHPNYSSATGTQSLLSTTTALGELLVGNGDMDLLFEFQREKPNMKWTQ